ncbi:MAG: SUF system Fe-S cluster assembly regulator [Acidobacteriota bacterium]
MIRMSRQTDYGLVLLLQFVREENQGRNLSARALAEATGLPVPMVSKVLKLLAREGLLVSSRGVNGGYTLARPPDKISLREVLTVLEGPLAMTECLDDESECVREVVCPMRDKWEVINSAVLEVFRRITLEELGREQSEKLVTIQSTARRPEMVSG